MSQPFEVSMTKCFFCGGDKDIVMNRVLSAAAAIKVHRLHGKVIDKEPCNTCKEYMKQGVMLVSAKDNDPDHSNPYRTGNLAVISEDAVKRIFDKEMADNLLKTRFGFIEDSAWDLIGLPKENINNMENKE